MKSNHVLRMLPIAALVRKFGFGRTLRAALLAAEAYTVIQARRRRSAKAH
jgi:hypothetical protein